MISPPLLKPAKEPTPCLPTEGPCTNTTCSYHITFTEALNCTFQVDRELTQAETGRALHITRSRVNQLEKAGLRKLRKYFDPDEFAAFSRANDPAFDEPHPVLGEGVAIARSMVAIG